MTEAERSLLSTHLCFYSDSHPWVKGGRPELGWGGVPHSARPAARSRQQTGCVPSPLGSKGYPQLQTEPLQPLAGKGRRRPQHRAQPRTDCALTAPSISHSPGQTGTERADTHPAPSQSAKSKHVQVLLLFVLTYSSLNMPSSTQASPALFTSHHWSSAAWHSERCQGQASPTAGPSLAQQQPEPPADRSPLRSVFCCSWQQPHNSITPPYTHVFP